VKKKPRKSRPEKPEDSAPATPRQPDEPGLDTVRCDLCGAPMYERHCRLICARCGYQRDCSDP